MYFLWFSLVLSSPLESENLVKALRYQYELQLKELRIENAKLQQQIHELKKKKPEVLQCEAASSPAKTKKPAKPDPLQEDDLSLYKKAHELVDASRWNDATLLLEQLVKDFPQSQYADNAIFLMAEVYRVKGELELARLEFLRLMESYPDSERYREAKLEIEKIESFQSQKDGR